MHVMWYILSPILWIFCWLGKRCMAADMRGRTWTVVDCPELKDSPIRVQCRMAFKGQLILTIYWPFEWPAVVCVCEGSTEKLIVLFLSLWWLFDFNQVFHSKCLWDDHEAVNFVIRNSECQTWKRFSSLSWCKRAVMCMLPVLYSVFQNMIRSLKCN